MSSGAIPLIKFGVYFSLVRTCTLAQPLEQPAIAAFNMAFFAKSPGACCCMYVCDAVASDPGEARSCFTISPSRCALSAAPPVIMPCPARHVSVPPSLAVHSAVLLCIPIPAAVHSALPHAPVLPSPAVHVTAVHSVAPHGALHCHIRLRPLHGPLRCT